MGGFRRWLWGPYPWEKLGKFSGGPLIVEVSGGRDYVYRPHPTTPFTFTRSTGEVITPRAVVTDGGSIPRPAWLVPGLDPWFYFPAYLIHDWEFVAHHCHADFRKSHAAVNDTLCEAVYTLMVTGRVPRDFRNVEWIRRGVGSRVGKRVWDAPWTATMCDVTLDPPPVRFALVPPVSLTWTFP